MQALIINCMYLQKEKVQCLSDGGRSQARGSAWSAAGREGRQERRWQALGAQEARLLDQSQAGVVASLVVFQQHCKKRGVVSGT